MSALVIAHPASPASSGSRPGWLRRVAERVLRVPLLLKLVGANVALAIIALVLHTILPGWSTALEVGVFLMVSLSVTGGLAWIALGPIQALEETAARVSQGDFSARVPHSPVADRDILRLTGTMNRLLDRVERDRARIHYLAGRCARARDIERESVARELRESFAQSLSGIAMQLMVAQQASANAVASAAIEQTRRMLNELTDDMRSVAETLYPGTLAEFGLRNAIEALARRISRRSGIEVQVDAGGFQAPMSAGAASALYRVAEEALRNIEYHAMARKARLRLTSNGQCTLEIEDDGRGVDMMDQDPLQAGLGLFSARAVLALLGGELQISSGPGLGTMVVARVPSGITHTDTDHDK